MKKILKILVNKFTITSVAFVVWMFFFDQNNYQSQQKRKMELHATEQNIAYLKSEIKQMEHDYTELISNPARLEKYAREQYKMKKDNEDVYLIERK